MVQGIVPRVRSVLMITALGAAMLLPMIASAATGPSGTWIGMMKTADGEDFEIRLMLDGMGTHWKGELSDPFMGKVELENLKVTPTRIGFTYRPANSPFPANFSGSYLAAKDRITGTFSMRGTSRFVKFDRSPEDLGGGPAALAEPAAEVRLRHDYRFAVTGRFSWWPSLHLVKDEVENLNNLTEAAGNVDGAVKWFVLDGFALYGRYYRGGQNMTDDQARLDRFPEQHLGADTYLKLDGWEIGATGYLGGKIMPESRFNPYLTAAGGKTSWALTSAGRGTDPVELNRLPLEGSDPSIMFGIGTEYELSRRMVLEFEWAWRYFMTQDDIKWPETDTTWTNTHAWCLSAGLTYGF